MLVVRWNDDTFLSKDPTTEGNAMQQNSSVLKYLIGHTFSNDMLHLKLITIFVKYWFVSLSSVCYLKFNSDILVLVDKLFYPKMYTFSLDKLI